jgi:serine/threonine protein kinase
MEPLSPQDPKNIGPWKLLNRIGAGGMGVVFYAEQKTKRVALKVVRNSFLDSPELKSRLEREVELMSQINSNRVAKVIDSGTDDAFAWVATEYINGPDLKEKVLSDGPLSRDEWFELAKGLLEALVAVHATGVIHRDIKPSNILLSDSGPKLIDFGIAQVSDATSLTATGVVAGSPAWLSPEQIHGDEITAATDIFSAGSVLVFAANGKSPWGDTTSTKTPVVFNRISNEKPDLESLSFHQKKIVEPMLVKNLKSRSQAKDSLKLISEYSKIDEEARLSEIKEQERIKKQELERIKAEKLEEQKFKKEQAEYERKLVIQEKQKQELRDRNRQKRNQKIGDFRKILSDQIKKISIIAIVTIVAVPISYSGINSYRNQTGIFSIKTDKSNMASTSVSEPSSSPSTTVEAASLSTASPNPSSDAQSNAKFSNVQICREARFLDDGPIDISQNKDKFVKYACWGPSEKPKVGYCLKRNIGEIDIIYTLYKKNSKVKTYYAKYNSADDDQSLRCNMPGLPGQGALQEGFYTFNLFPSEFQLSEFGDKIVWYIDKSNFKKDANSDKGFEDLVDEFKFIENNNIEKNSYTEKTEAVKSSKSKVCRNINGRGSGCWTEGSAVKIGPCVSTGEYWYQSEFIKDGNVFDKKIGNFTIDENNGIDDCVFGSNKKGKESATYPPTYFDLKKQIDSVNTVIQGNGWNEYIVDYYSW